MRNRHTTRSDAKPRVLDRRGSPMTDSELLRDAKRAAEAWRKSGYKRSGPVTNAMTPRERPVSTLSESEQRALAREWYGEPEDQA